MNKITTKMRILAYMRSRGEISGTELEDQAGAWFTKSSVISRRARELCAEGYLERSIGKHGAVQYRIPVSSGPSMVHSPQVSNAKAIPWL